MEESNSYVKTLLSTRMCLRVRQTPEMDDLRKRSKQDFITGHHGSDLLEIYLILWIVVVGASAMDPLWRLGTEFSLE